MPDELLVLGSSSAISTARRFPTAFALKVTGGLFLVDCGAPVSTLLYRHELDPLDVQAVFLSHWHLDHIANLGLFLGQNHQLRRPNPLKLYGPRGTQGKVRRLLEDSFLTAEELSYALDITNAQNGDSFTEGLLRATFFKTQHLEQSKVKAKYGKKAVACGLILEGPDWRIVYSGDVTSPQELSPYVENCDLLVHEMAHCQPEAVAEFAEVTKIPHVLISHLAPQYDETPHKIQQIISKYYHGEVIIAEDGTKVRLSQIKRSRTIQIDPPAMPPERLVRSGQIRLTVASNKNATDTGPMDLDQVEVVLTLNAGAEDAAIMAKAGVVDLRRRRMVRLQQEAQAQGGMLTSHDLATLLNVDLRTIQRDANAINLHTE